MENNDILVLRDNARNQLLQIKTVEEGISYLNKLKAIDIWVKAEKKDAELQNIVAEQKIRTQRILGELIAEGQRKGTIATENNHGGGIQATVSDGNRRNLADIGLNKKQSSTFQQIASIPEDDFEDFIQEKKQAVHNAVSELTTTGAVKLAKSLQEKKTEMRHDHERQARLDAEDELRKLAQQVNLNYTKDQRRFFVNLIKI